MSCLFFSINSFAKTLDGYYITLEDDTIEAQLEIPVFFGVFFREIQQGVKVKDKYIHNKSLNLYPENIKEYGFEFKGKQIRMISCYDPLKNCYYNQKHSTFIFLRLVQEGKHLSYFQFQYKAGDRPGQKEGWMTSKLHFFRKGESGEIYRHRPWKFKKDLANYLSDCSEVKEKILNKTYRRKDVEIIIDQYDKCIDYLDKKY